MPRNSNGDYSLPAGNPVVTGTVISSTWANTTMEDLGDAITDSLSRNGEGAMLAPLQLASGAVGAPALTWSAETTSGLYRQAAGVFRWAQGGADKIQIDTNGLQVLTAGTAANPSLLLSSSQPILSLNETDAAVDNRKWDILPSAESLIFRIVNDAGSATATWLTVNRTGTNVDDVTVSTATFVHSGATFRHNSAAPRFLTDETDAPADERLWDITSAAGDWVIRTRTDADGAGANAYVIARTGTTVDTHTFLTGSSSTATFSTGGMVLTTSSGPAIFMVDSDSDVDEKRYRVRNTAGQFQILTESDAGLAVATAILIDRTGTTVDLIDLNATLITIDGGSGASISIGASGIASIAGLTATGQILNSDANPSLYINETDAAADEKLWRLTMQTGILQWQTRTDANGGGAVFFTANRTGTVVDNVGLAAGVGGNITFDVAGTTRLTIATAAITSTERFRGPNGAAADPAYSFSSDTDTGWYLSAVGDIRLAVGGSPRLLVTTSVMQMVTGTLLQLVDGAAATPGLSFVSDPNTGIFSQAADALDISAGGLLAGRFAIDGGGSAGLFLNSGTAALPSLSFIGDGNTGIYRIGADQIGFSTSGTLRLSLTTSALVSTVSIRAPDGAVGTPGLSFDSDSNTGFFRDTADQIAIALGGAAGGQIAQGSFTATLTGMSASTTATVNYTRIGQHVTLRGNTSVNFTGTSNANTMTMTGLPSVVQPTNFKETLNIRVINNGAVVAIGVAQIGGATITFGLGIDNVQSGFTASGTKGLSAGWMIQYTVD